MDHMYQLVYLLVTYLLPLICLSITYTYLGRILWRIQWGMRQGREGIDEEDASRARRGALEKRRVGIVFINI